MHSFFYGGRWAGRRFAGPAVAGASMGRLAAFSLLELRSALDSAPLHLVHGLRPMRKGRGYGALMQAWGGIPPSFSRTAHCLRGHYTSNFLICIVQRQALFTLFSEKSSISIPLLADMDMLLLSFADVLFQEMGQLLQDSFKPVFSRKSSTDSAFAASLSQAESTFISSSASI